MKFNNPEIKNLMENAKSDPDFKYERDKDPKRIEEIEEGINNPKIESLEVDGENIEIEYIDVPSKEKAREKEKVILILPGFAASYRPFGGTVKELASYIGDQRVICVSPPDSGESTTLKNYSLEKVDNIYKDLLTKLGLDESSCELTIIAHSRSDVVALDMSVRNPELVKNIVLTNGIMANESDLAGLTYDFLNHVNFKITPERIKGAFKGEEQETEAAINYWNQNIDFFKNILNPKRAWNQFTSLQDRKKIELDELLSQLSSNILLMSSTIEFTNNQNTREKIFEKIPDDVDKQLRTEVEGRHDEITAHPEAFALKVRRWLESLEQK